MSAPLAELAHTDPAERNSTSQEDPSRIPLELGGTMINGFVEEQEPQPVDSPETIDSPSGAITEIREIPGTEGFYNAGAWVYEGTTYLLGRNVEAAAKKGEPDVGPLVLATLDSTGNIASSREVWRPTAGQHLLEDARAQPLPDGRIALGLTSVIQEHGDNVPYPSVLVVSMKELLEGTLPEPTVIKVMGGGKNATPLGPDLFAFRSEANYHQLQVFEYRGVGEAVHKQVIDFPSNIPSSEQKVGTTIPPIWLNENEALFPIHGIEEVDGISDYSIDVSSRLLKDEAGMLSVDNISQEPEIVPDLFAGMFDGQEVELHPDERRVVYCTGGIPVYDESGKLEYLKLYVNVGDKRTVEVTMSVDKIIEGWHRDEPAEQKIPIAA